MRFVFPMIIAIFVISDAAAVEGWRSEVLLETGAPMGGAAIGDLDPNTPGSEVAVVTETGEAWMVRRGKGEWTSERVHKGGGELIMCAVGDVDPGSPGSELVGVGMVEGAESLSGPGHVVVVKREGGRWVGEGVFQDDHMIHGVAVGDVSSRHEGNEIIVCGFDHRVTMLSFAGGRWHHETVYVGNDRMKIGAVGDVLPVRPGREIVVSGSDGRVVVLWEGKLGWCHEVIYTDRAGQSRVSVGESGILIGGDKGKVTLAVLADGQWETEFLGRDWAKIRGVAIGDVDGIQDGAEAYACGYSSDVVQFVHTDKGYWEHSVIFSATRPLHHLLAGDFDPDHDGPELLTCGHGGKLIAIYPKDQENR